MENGPAHKSAVIAHLEKELALIRTLNRLSNLDFDRSYIDRMFQEEIDLPEGPENWTLILRWQALSIRYSNAMKRILALMQIRLGQGFCDLSQEEVANLNFESFELSQKTADAFNIVARKQSNCGVLVIPFQFGGLYAGRNAWDVTQKMPETEFDLDPVNIGLKLLMYPDRLSRVEDLGINCAGATCSSKVGKPLMPCFNFAVCDESIPAIQFAAVPYDKSCQGHFGSATGFNLHSF